MNPYSPPEAPVGLPQSGPRQRPFSVWLTLALTVFVILLELVVLTTFAWRFATDVYGSFRDQVIGLTCIHAAMLALTASLAYGLIRARRWAWYAGLGFAACLFALMVLAAYRLGDVPAGTTAYRIGYEAGRILFTLFPAAHLIGFYFSRSVRAYFRV